MGLRGASTDMLSVRQRDGHFFKETDVRPTEMAVTSEAKKALKQKNEDMRQLLEALESPVSPRGDANSATAQGVSSSGDDDVGMGKRREGKQTDFADGTSGRLGPSGRLASTVTDVEAIGCHICRGLDGGGQMLTCDTCSGAWHLHCLDPPLAQVPSMPWMCPTCHRAAQPSPAALPSKEATWPLQVDGRTEKETSLSAMNNGAEFIGMVSLRNATTVASLGGAGGPREVGQRASETATGIGAPDWRGRVVAGGDSSSSPRLRSPRDARQTGSAARRAHAATGADGGRGMMMIGGLPPSNPGNDDERPVDSPGTHQVSPQAGDGKDRLDGLTLPQVSPSAPAYESPKQGAMKGDSSRSAAKTRSVVLEDLPRLDSVLRNDAYLPPNLVSPRRGAGVAAGARANPAAAYLDAYAFRQTERSRYSPYTRRIRACLR